MDYKFLVGEDVSYSPAGERVGAFTVVRLMPENDNIADARYLIKSKSEHFERVVMEYDLIQIIETPEKAARRAYLAGE
jgi:hypothetical protein